MHCINYFDRDDQS